MGSNGFASYGRAVDYVEPISGRSTSGEKRYVLLRAARGMVTVAGLLIEFLHEFPFAARAKFSFMEQGKDGWWRLPEPYHGTVPFLFSLQALKPESVS